MSQASLAGRMKVAQTTISKWERGESEPSLSDIDALTRIFGRPYQSVSVTTHNREDLRVPVMGTIGRAQRVIEPAELEHIALPPGAPSDAKALIVRGEALPPFKDGAALLYWTSSQNPAVFLGELCLVVLAGGERYVRTIVQGDLPETWTLLSPTDPPIINVAVVCVWLIEATFRKPIWLTTQDPKA